MEEALYFEDLPLGFGLRSLGRTISETDIVNFVCLAGIHEELFTNMEYAATTVYGGRIAPGALIYSIAEGLSITAQRYLNGSAIAFLGLDSLDIFRPTRPGDTIWVEVKVVDRRLTSSGERGVVTYDHTVVNQKAEAIMRYRIKRLIRCRGGVKT